MPDQLSTPTRSSPTCDSPDDKQGFFSIGYCVRKRSVRRIVRQVLLAGEKPQEWPALLRHVVANSAAQHWIRSFESVQDRAQCRRPLDLKVDFAVDMRQPSQMGRKLDSDHCHLR